MFSGMSLLVLIIIFLAAAAAVWVAGIALSDTSDLLSERFGLGEALGGLILLAIATNLPEIAITVSAGLSHQLDIAIGNILGGIAIQTVVLALLDAVGLHGQPPLTWFAASLVLVLEGGLVIGVLIVAIMASMLSGAVSVAGVGPGDLLIVIFWGIGLWLLGKARTDLPWQEKGVAPGAQKGRGVAQAEKVKQAKDKGHSTTRTVVVFALASVVTLAAGVVLEQSGEAIATDWGLSGVLFGATFLAAATALPELSTGLAAVKLGDYQLAFSDIFGGNAFLPVLFIVASVLSGQSALPQATSVDIYEAGLGILLTTVYIWGLVFRPKRNAILGMGVDSFVVVVLYVLGTVGLIAISRP
ncbi:MAG: sodium:proton exchanger [Candidatus Chloroheliales bacterium]|nr:MAG: sodium:proton exchanger [Chloroflexota bacterium]